MGSTSLGRSSNTMAILGAWGHLMAVVALLVPSVQMGVQLLHYLEALTGDSWWVQRYRYISVTHQRLVSGVLIAEAVFFLGGVVMALQLLRLVHRRLLGTRMGCFLALLFDAASAAGAAFATAALAHGVHGPSAVERVIPQLLAFVAACFFLAVVLVGSTRYTAKDEG